MPENLLISYETLDFDILSYLPTFFKNFSEENLINHWIPDYAHYLQSRHRHDEKHNLMACFYLQD